MSGLVFPAGVDPYKKERKHHAIQVCVVHLVPDGEDEDCDVLADMIVRVDVGPIRAKTNMGRLIMAAYAIPEEERKGYYTRDVYGNRMEKDINGEPFALCEIGEFFMACQSDMQKMADGDEILNARSGVAYFCMHGVKDNPLYEPKIAEGVIKILLFRA